jgi:hypothetical protein
VYFLIWYFLVRIRIAKTNGNIEFLQPYPVVAADALFQIVTTVISAVLSLHERLSQTFPLSRNFVSSRRIFLFGTSSSGFALLNASLQQQTILMQSNIRE